MKKDILKEMYGKDMESFDELKEELFSNNPDDMSERCESANSTEINRDEINKSLYQIVAECLNLN